MPDTLNRSRARAHTHSRSSSKSKSKSLQQKKKGQSHSHQALHSFVLVNKPTLCKGFYLQCYASVKKNF
ncbi:hypothetical protein CMV_001858 [Castanea mollissima]|uniref:Uncharacterized protein n=1 Tax=Castanea mollissima TaxID=60419 RepID=A0A8J4W668_9ROSI|nr:hypothetical protein CMV_001858 [Castanea mollissima]